MDKLYPIKALPVFRREIAQVRKNDWLNFANYTMVFNDGFGHPEEIEVNWDFPEKLFYTRPVAEYRVTSRWYPTP